MWKILVPVLVVALLGTAAYFFYQGSVARERVEQMAAPAPAPVPAPAQTEELPVFDPDQGAGEEVNEQALELEECLKDAMSDPAARDSQEQMAQALKDCQEATAVEE